jgi:hypothetical protein
MGLIPVDKDLYALVDSCGEEGVVLPQLGVAVVGKNSVSDQNVIRLRTASDFYEFPLVRYHTIYSF